MKYMSLYEYLGRAAGADLGKAIGLKAYTEGIDIMRRTIVTATYKGEVNTYPEKFLQQVIPNKSISVCR